MKYEQRWYQAECAQALWDAMADTECKPVVAIPTGAGKTVILALFIQKWLEMHPHDEILVLTHTKKIIQQDIKALEIFFPDQHIGAYSAGLQRREHQQITVGGIQSIIKNPNEFRWANLVIVDEVHKVSHKNEGSYRKLLDTMQARLAGLSATVFRTGHGYIYEGKGTLFNKLVYDLTSIKNYNRLEKEGYLAPLIAVAPALQLDSSQVKKSAGDYNVKALAETHDKETITREALKEALYYGKNYKKWLVFAIDIEHAEHITDQLNDLGILSRVLHSRVSDDEESILNSFTHGKTRALVSVEKITTGFDAPCVDLILMLRPTMSAILHVQMAGRGVRPFKNKKHCLFLDYAGNTARLGPINDVIVPKKGNKTGEGEAPTKNCPNCRTIVAAIRKECPSCGHQFLFESKLTTGASTDEIVAKGEQTKERWLTVQRAQYNLHTKPGRPDSILITYHCGLTKVKEWLCIEHGGFAGQKAKHVLQYRGYQGSFSTFAVFKAKDTLKVPKQILVDFTPKYPNITNARF